MVKVCLIFVYVFLVAAPSWAQTFRPQTVKLTWGASTSADVTGYAACFRTTAFPQDAKSDDFLTDCPIALVVNAQATMAYAAVPGAQDQQWFVRLVARDDQGNISDWSNEATFTVKRSRPEAPTVTITVTFSEGIP